MNLSKAISLISLIMITTLWGCAGDNSGGTATAVTQQKSAQKSLLTDQKITNDANDNGHPKDKGQPAVAYCNYSVPNIGRSPYMVVWTYTNTDGTTDIKGQIWNGSGTGNASKLNAAGPVIDICTTLGNQSQPKVAFDSDLKRYMVLLTDARNNDYSQIYGRFIKSDGSFSGTEFPVSTHRDSPSSYIVTGGTINVTNGSKTITGSGTL